MVFGTSHADFQETVAVAVVKGSTARAASAGGAGGGAADAPASEVTLAALRAWGGKRLPGSHLPQLAVFVDQLPRGGPTGKLQRVAYAEKLRVPPIVGGASRSFYVHGDALSAESASLEEIGAAPPPPPPPPPPNFAPPPTFAPPKAFAATPPPPAAPIAPDLAYITSSVLFAVRAVPSVGGREVSPTEELSSVGVGSLESVELVEVLRGAFPAAELPITLLFECFTATEVAEYIRERLMEAKPDDATTTEPTATASANVFPPYHDPQQLPPSSSTATHRLQPTPPIIDAVAVSIPPDIAPPPTKQPTASIAAPASKPRCLFLHGRASDAALMSSLLAGSNWHAALGDVLEFVCADAVHEAEPLPKFYSALVDAAAYGEAVGKKHYYDHGVNELIPSEHERYVRESIESVERRLLSDPSLVAIGGICDGALIAAVVAARNTCGRLQLYINCCGTPFSSLPPIIREGTPLVRVPSIHLLGLKDELLSDQKLLSLTGRCVSSVVLRHKQGHVVPMLTSSLERQLRYAIGRATGFEGAGGVGGVGGMCGVGGKGGLSASTDYAPSKKGHAEGRLLPSGFDDSLDPLAEEGMDSIDVFKGAQGAVRRSADDARRGHFWFICMFLLVVAHACHIMPIPGIDPDDPSAGWLVTRLADVPTAWSSIGLKGFIVAAGQRDLLSPPTGDRVWRSILLPVAFSAAIFITVELMDMIVRDKPASNHSFSLIYLFLFFAAMRLINHLVCTKLGLPRWAVAAFCLLDYVACSVIACPLPLQRVLPRGVGGSIHAYRAATNAEPSALDLIRIGEFGVYYALLPLLLPRTFLGELPRHWAAPAPSSTSFSSTTSSPPDEPNDHLSRFYRTIRSYLSKLSPMPMIRRRVPPSTCIRTLSALWLLAYFCFPIQLRLPFDEPFKGHFLSPQVFDDNRYGCELIPAIATDAGGNSLTYRASWEAKSRVYGKPSTLHESVWAMH